jgi:peptide/nickel transport system substrate-binding protein
MGLALTVAACGGSSDSGGSGNSITIDNASGAQWTCNFNPFNPNANVDRNLMYEPLFVINDLSATYTPWLATSYAWGNGNKQLTVKLRKGVKWTDGKPFTAKDVAFTFNVEKAHPELDGTALWSGGLLDKVTAKDDTTVVFDFKRVSTTALRYILDGQANRIKPEHIWSKVKDPAKKSTKDAVGTGPYKVSSCSPQSVIYGRNDGHWKGKPKIAKVIYPAFTDNGPANQFLAQGKAQWGGQFVPDVEEQWQSKDPKNRKIWYPSLTNVGVSINQTKAMFKNKLVRQALVYAINKEDVSEKGMYGYQKPANQGMVVESMKAWANTAAEEKYGYTNDCSKTEELMEKAGFKRGAGKMFVQPGGKPFKPELIVNGGFTDWVGAVKIIGKSMKACGVDVQVNNLAGQQFNTRRDNGQFDLAYDSQGGGDTPYYELRNHLYSKLTKPVGKATGTNRARFSDPKADKLIEAYDKTTDKAEQKKIVNQLQEIMLDQVPFIPTTQNVAWAQMDHSKFTGWPSAGDPYANPAPYATDWQVVLLRLTPVKKK